MSKPIDLKRAIEDIYNTSPLLIIGEARLLFIKAWKYKINSVSNTKELRDIIDYYSTVQDNKPIVIDDLSLLQENSLKLLLKLVEESKSPIILLGTYDNIDKILLSRIKTYIRFKESIKSEFLDFKSFYEQLQEKDFSDSRESDKILFYLKKCPKYLSLDYDIKTSSNKNKILSILSSEV